MSVLLSLFDGKSSAFTACEIACIEVNKYYSAEIDKYAIQVSNAIHPNQTRLGDVTKWREWNIDWASIDIIVGGFPCQAWSMAGKQLGDKDERGMLFWVMLDIMKHVRAANPKVQFLIENVKMKKEFEKYITFHMADALGMFEFNPEETGEAEYLIEECGKSPLHKILINSALVSAQNRNRYYWTSFPVTQPEDRGIVLSDIIETEGDGAIKSHGEWKSKGYKSQCIDANYHKGVDNHGQRTVIIQRARGNNPGGVRAIDGKTPTLSANSWEHNNHLAFKEKSRCIRASGRNSPPGSRQNWDNVLDSKINYRKLTPRECFRLQTTPEYYIDLILNCGVSNTQLYKIAGNGMTDEVIAHILKAAY